MALRFMDSFNHYTSSADFLLKWTTNSSSTISAGNGRFATGCLRFTNFNQGATKSIDAQGTWIIGFSLKLSALPSATVRLFKWMDAGSTQMEMKIQSTGAIQVMRNGTAVTGGTSVNTMTAGVWYHIEWKTKFLDSISSGDCAVRVNGTEWLTVSAAQDTKATANTTADSFGFCADFNEARTIDVSDLYVLDGTGSSNNDYVGDCRVEALFPNGDGTYSQFTGSDGNSANNSLLVDETAPNGDTDYVESSTATQIDTYSMADLSSTPNNVRGTQTVLYARKTDAGTRQMAALMRIAATDYAGATHDLGSSFQMHMHCRDVSPNTGIAFTASEINAIEAGPKLIA